MTQEEKSTTTGGEESQSAASATPDATDEAGESSSGARQISKRTRVRAIRGTIGVLGFIAGIIAGTYGEQLIARADPDFFGPDNQMVIDEQNANFQALDSKLKQLKLNASKDPATAQLVGELSELLQEQKNLAAKKDELFKAADIENKLMKDQLLNRQGVSSGVDFWIRPGESMILHDPDKVLAVLGTWTGDDGIEVNLSSQTVKMRLGDKIEFETTDGPRVLIYRHVRRESDQRYGFDLARPQTVTKN